MHVNQVYELSMMLDNEQFYEIANAAYYKSDAWIDEKHEYTDRSLTDKGITVKYRNSRYKKKVKMIVKTSEIFRNGIFTSDELVQKIEKRISKYFDNRFPLDAFTLSRILVTTNIDVGNQDKVNAYIHVFRRIGKVKGFTPVHHDELDSHICFSLEGNSNGVHAVIYDLRGVIKAHINGLDVVPPRAQSLLDDAAGILQVEIGLQPKAIQKYTDEFGACDQIKTLSENKEEILLKNLARIVPFGKFYKKHDTLETICKNVRNRVLQRKMIQLVTLIPEKKSILLAQRAMNHRKIDEVMVAFEKIDLSPVTIGKRQNVRYLENIYSYLV